MKENPIQKSNKDIASDVFDIVTESLEKTKAALGTSFDKAIDTILNHKGKIVVCGVGKSGRLAQKVAATFSSTGTPAVFLHAYEAVHGDLGVYEPGDPTILFSKSGSTAELVRLMPILRQFNSPTIVIANDPDSPLAQKADVFLHAYMTQEADPLRIVPTTSVHVSMAIADALACALMYKRSFTEKDFARFHPGGQLGQNLLHTVSDVMHGKDKIACITPNTSLKNIVEAMTDRNYGAACVVREDQTLAGIITDGDIRRLLLQTPEKIASMCAEDMMSTNLITIDPGCLLGQAIQLMEDRPSQISVLPVVCKDTQTFLGLIRIHDIYQPH